jgi:hypothetical protein
MSAIQRTFVVCAIGLSAVTAHAEDQSWLSNSASVGLGGPWSLRLTHERRTTGLDYGGGFLDNGSLSLQRRLGTGVAVAVGYLRESARRGIEDRLELDAGIHRRLSDRLELDLRLRLERRQFARATAPDSTRARLQIRLRSKARLGRMQLRPFGSEEVFADSVSEQLSESRLIIGAGVPAGRHAEWLIGYLRQDVRGRATVHALNTGFDLRF